MQETEIQYSPANPGPVLRVVGIAVTFTTHKWVLKLKALWLLAELLNQS